MKCVFIILLGLFSYVPAFAGERYPECLPSARNSPLYAKCLALRLEAERADERRACAYYELFLDSDRNNLFPLVAAHATLWSGKLLQRVFWVTQLSGPLTDFNAGLESLGSYVFRHIYVTLKLVREYGDDPDIGLFIDRDVLEALQRLRKSLLGSEHLSAAERAVLYRALLGWEQGHVLNTLVEDEIHRLPLAYRLMVRHPISRLYYFPFGKYFTFRDFGDWRERAEKSWKAYQIAERVGLAEVEESLRARIICPF